MPETFLGGRVTLWLGDVRAMLAQMPPDSVDCVVTSPPYWGLRDYGVEGQIGLEATLGEHLSVMVEVFALVRRVIKPTGTLWVNYGDCYATAPNGRSAADTKAAGTDDRTFRDKPFSTIGPISAPSGTRVTAGAERTDVDVGGWGARDASIRWRGGGVLKPKDLCMVPNRLAIALQDDGWWVRSEIVWGKTNPMPDSSGAYRPSTAHEKIFLLTKSDDGEVYRARDTGEISFFPDLSERCPLVTDPSREAARWSRIGAYYDAEAVRQGQTSDEDANGFRGGSYVGGEPGRRKEKGNRRVKMPDGWDTGPGVHGKFHRQGREAGKRTDKQSRHSRRHDGFNDRWEDAETRRGLTPRHEGGINHTGLAALGRGEGRFLRNYEPAPPVAWPMATKAFSDAHFATFPPELAARCIAAGCPPAGLVLDPFGGSGTTALVAARMGRRAALIELNPEYAGMARRRIEREWMGEVERVMAERRPSVTPIGGLFGALDPEAAE